MAHCWIWGPRGGICGWRARGGYRLFWDESGEITPSLCMPAGGGGGGCAWERFLWGEENALVSGSVKQGGCSPTDFVSSRNQRCVCVGGCRLALHTKWSEDEKGGVCL